MTHADRPCPMNEQTVGWVLHSLEPDEEIEVRNHLAECASCRDLAVRGLAGISSGL